MIIVSCVLPSVVVGASPLGLLEGQTDFVRVSGAPVLSSSLFTPRRRGTLPSYAFVRVKRHKSCEKLFQIQEIIIITKIHFLSQTGVVGYEENPPSVCLVPETHSRLHPPAPRPLPPPRPPRALCFSGRESGLPPAASLHPAVAQPFPSKAWLFLELSVLVRFPPVVPHAAVQTEHVVWPNKGTCVLQTIPLSLGRQLRRERAGLAHR